MLCYVMWNLFTVGSLQFPNDSTIASLEGNQNRCLFDVNPNHVYYSFIAHVKHYVLLFII